MMTFYQETASKRGGGGWRAVGQKIGCSGAYARQLAMGTKPITPEIAGDWLIVTGWQVKRHEVDACPDCGDVHTGRCNGNPVAAVVTLAPGETVRITNGTKRQRKTAKRLWIPDTLAKECEEAGMDNEDMRIAIWKEYCKRMGYWR
jgi:hypothetical protein